MSTDKEEDCFIVCDCSTDEHTVRFSYQPEYRDMIPELYIHYQLHQWRGFWKRVWVALRYIFRRKEIYGYWDVTLINTDNVIQLRDFLNSKYPVDKYPAS